MIDVSGSGRSELPLRLIELCFRPYSLSEIYDTVKVESGRNNEVKVSLASTRT